MFIRTDEISLSDDIHLLRCVRRSLGDRKTKKVYIFFAKIKNKIFFIGPRSGPTSEKSKTNVYLGETTLDYIGLHADYIVAYIGLHWTALDYTGLHWTTLDHTGLQWRFGKLVPY